MENSQIEEPDVYDYNRPTDEEPEQPAQETLSELNHARRVIAQLETALNFVRKMDPQKEYPGEHASARALGACQGEAIVALCSIPPMWRAA